MSEEKLGAMLGLLHIEPGDLSREENFGLRMRVQRVAYLLQHMGEEGFAYNFSTYFRGPYSVDLAKASSMLTRTGNASLKNGELAVWFFKHDLDWLRGATTIMMVHPTYTGRRDKEFEGVKFYMPKLTVEEYDKTIAELKGRGILAD